MLILPDEYQTYRLLSIDPGLNNMGFALFTMDSHNEQIIDIKTRVMVSEKLRDYSGLDVEDHGERLVKLFNIENTFYRILEEFDPNVVGSESPFFDPRKPIAFAALVDVMSTIYRVLARYNQNLLLTKIAPQLVKKTLGIAGKKGKEIVMESVEKVPEIMAHFPEGLTQLTEHEIDAIVVGYTLILRRRGVIKED